MIDAKKIREYINQFLSPFPCGYRKGFSTQTVLVCLNRKWKHEFDNNGAILMDL